MDELPPSARALREALREPRLAARIKSRLHRVTLSRYCNARSKPSLDTAQFLEVVTEGRVSMAGWATAWPPTNGADEPSAPTATEKPARRRAGRPS